jgi:hypothetical protein
VNIVASIGLKSNLRPVETSTGNVQLPPTGRLLLSAARMTTKWPGAKSRFGKYFRRKFAEQGRGASYHVQTNRRFLFSGLIGDNVDNKIAIDLDYEPALSDFIAREAAGTKAFLDIGCNVGWFSCPIPSWWKRARGTCGLMSIRQTHSSGRSVPSGDPSPCTFP